MNKKGFTLIELLAVIIVLSIISLIVTPIITGIIESTRINAVERSVEGYNDAIEKRIVSSMLNPNNKLLDGIYDVPIENVEVKGSIPSTGWVKIEQGKIADYSYVINNFVVTQSSKTISGNEPIDKPESSILTLPKNLSIGSEVYINPEKSVVCGKQDYDKNTNHSIGGTKKGCMKWYVYKDNNDGTYQLILDHNTTPLVAWSSDGKTHETETESKQAVTIKAQLVKDIESWSGKAKNSARLITANEIAKITNHPIFDSKTATFNDDFYLDSNNHVQITNKDTKSNYAWLFDNTYECTDYGCNTKDNSAYGYWTSSPVHNVDNTAWGIHRNASLLRDNVDRLEAYGLRPVITF